MAQYFHRICHNNLLALLRILSYVEGTIDYGIKYEEGITAISYNKTNHNIEVHRGTSKATITEE